LYRALPTPDGTGIAVLSTRDGGLRYYDRASGELRVRINLPDYAEFEDADFAIVGEQPPRALVVRQSEVALYDLVGASPPRVVELPTGDGIGATVRAGLWGFLRREVSTQTGALWLRWLQADGASTSALELAASERPDAWSLSNDGRQLAINYYPSNLTEVLDLERSELVASIPAPEWGGNVAFAPSGRYLALGGEHLALHAADDGRWLASDKAFGNNISDLRFTPDGGLLLVSAYDGKVRSYAMPSTGALPEKLPAPQLLQHARRANVYALGLSRDARLLVSPSGDKTVKLWVR
jgi:WD40 repeat protein